MSWTPEREEKLKELWNKGHTGSQIANMLGETTRNAVIGKAHRMKLKTRSVSKKTSSTVSPKKSDIAETKNQRLIKVKVWERGAGITKACGTAACATAVVAYKKKLTQNNVDIQFELGVITINIDNNNSINMKGKVSEIKEIDVKI